MGTITGKFYRNSLKTVDGVAETSLCVWTDGRKDGRTDEPITLVPFDLRRGTKREMSIRICTAINKRHAI